MSTVCVISIAVTITLGVVCVGIFVVYSTNNSTKITSATDAPEVIPDFNPDPTECLTDSQSFNESMKTDFIEACNDIAPPAYGIHERGSCYVFAFTNNKLTL